MAGAALQLFLMTASAGMGRDDDASVARLFARITDVALPDATSSPLTDAERRTPLAD
jgi:3-hydroxyisobutyrate dehydrogenase